MGRHLQLNRWMRRTNAGNLQLLRVSRLDEEHFPKRYRECLQDYGATATVKMLMDEGMTLAEAWVKLKAMVNTD